MYIILIVSQLELWYVPDWPNSHLLLYNCDVFIGNA